jgi:hypothetical protein
MSNGYPFCYDDFVRHLRESRLDLQAGRMMAKSAKADDAKLPGFDLI